MTDTIKFSNAPISIYKSTGMSGQISRRLFITIEDLNTIPEELFKVKVSQSQSPSLAGKAVFKYFSYKINEESAFSPLAPEGTTTATPLGELKAAVVAKLGAIPGAKFSIAINMNGRFGNISTSEGVYTVFDNEQFAANEGNPPYYLKAGVRADVTLTDATSKYGPYYRIDLSTGASPDDIFQTSSRAKVYGQDSDDVEDTVAPAAEDTAGSVW